MARGVPLDTSAWICYLRPRGWGDLKTVVQQVLTTEQRKSRRGGTCPGRPCSPACLWAADTTHPDIIPLRLECARASAGCHGTWLAVARLRNTDDVVTRTLGPHATDGERLDTWGARQRQGPFDRRRYRIWRPLLREPIPTGTYHHEQSASKAVEPLHVHV